MLRLALAAALIVSAGHAARAQPGSRACTAQERARLLAPTAPGDDVATLACSVTLAPDERVQRRILIAGAEASGVTLGCNGATIGEAGETPDPKTYTVEIVSKPLGPGPDGRPRWSRPFDVTLRHCTILGPIRVWGMGRNGQGEAVRESSYTLGHTERAQEAAPTRVRILDSRLIANGAIPLYLAPGVTESALIGSQVTGRSRAVAVYLDAESAGNVIENNSFDIATGREVLAVDGSARNRITGNRFVLHWMGGVYLYRNCGEGGTVRHQTPSDNTITGNRFRHAGVALRRESIVVGAREGWSLNCRADDGYPFGSSLDDGDHAERNRVEDNRDE